MLRSSSDSSVTDLKLLIKKRLTQMHELILKLPNDSEAIVYWIKCIDALEEQFSFHFRPVVKWDYKPYLSRQRSRSRSPVYFDKRRLSLESKSFKTRTIYSSRFSREYSDSSSENVAPKHDFDRESNYDRCNFCRKHGHHQKTCPILTNIKCFRCNRYGHQAKKCLSY